MNKGFKLSLQKVEPAKEFKTEKDIINREGLGLNPSMFELLKKPYIKPKANFFEYLPARIPTKDGGFVDVAPYYNFHDEHSRDKIFPSKNLSSIANAFRGHPWTKETKEIVLRELENFVGLKLKYAEMCGNFCLFYINDGKNYFEFRIYHG